MRIRVHILVEENTWGQEENDSITCVLRCASNSGMEEFSTEPDPLGPSPKRYMEVGGYGQSIASITVPCRYDCFLEPVSRLLDGKDLLAASRHGS